MRRGLSHPESSIQQRARSLTHHSLGCICPTTAALAASQIIPFFPEDSPPNSSGPSSCSSLNSPLREVLLCFFQSTAQAGSSRHRNILFQLPAHLQQPTARSYSLRWARSKCSDGAGSSTRSAAQQERTGRFESVKSERKKKKNHILVFFLSAIIKKQGKKPDHKTVSQSITNPQSSTKF